MLPPASAPRRRSRLAVIGLSVLGVALILIGALLVILGTSGLFDVSLLGSGLPPELPGLIVIGTGFSACSARGGLPATERY